MNEVKNIQEPNKKAWSITFVMHRFFRISKLRLLHNYQNCDGCGRFTNKIYTIPYIEAGLLVCKKCDDTD